MKKLYFFLPFLIALFYASLTEAQNCAAIHASFQTYESRCAATGAIKISADGGSGSYKYRVSGPVTINYTTSDSITGLSAGTYKVEIVDVLWNCSFIQNNVQVGGDYSDPRFILHTTSVGCDNGSNGMIQVEGLHYGRSPFTFSIVAPSPMGVGTSNTTGLFTGLTAGDYSIRLTDSCGGIQTRTVSIENYSWKIDSYSFTKFSCDSAYGYLRVSDSRGNVSTITGIPGFKYAIVKGANDTIWSTDPNFRFQVNGVTSIQALAMDSCGNIKSVSTSLFLKPSLGATVNISDKTCTSFTASLTSINNFFNGDYCIYDQNDVQIACDPNGVFPNLPYGDYCIKAHDGCTDSTIIRCISVQAPVPSVADDVLIYNKTCTKFTAEITGLVNITDPIYLLFTGTGTFLGLQFTGVFTDLAYGDYCINVMDRCSGVSLERCFSARPPQPIIPEVIIPSYVNCVNFGLDIGGDSLTSPNYCLMDTLGNVIACNTTGIFDSIPLGSYCVTVHDACLDTTIERCFSVGPPTVTDDVTVRISNKVCLTFTATVNTSNMAGGSFCLYDTADNLISCDSSGVFNGLAYGSYCVKTHSSCPDTTLVTCFNATAPVPAIDANVSMNGRTCNSFTATVKGQQNLTNPLYYLTDNTGDTLSSNATGKFTDLPYGSYCILVKDGCYDTTMSVCFSAAASPFTLTASASKSCNYGYSRFNLSFNTYPVSISIFDTANTMIYSHTVTGSVVVDSIPDLPDGYKYRIVAIDACGNEADTSLAPVVGFLNNYVQIQQKCPGAGWANGSGNINAIATTNTGTLTVRIINKNGSTLSPYLVPDVVKDSVFTFQDMEPATYIVRFNSNDGCNVYKYDTVTVNPYQYPNLNRSSAYQCDVNGFSVGAVVTDGVGPFTYEIIGSTPATPSIIAAPQSSPVFTIDNGYNYSLIRLRALDACGNATLGDASILPLASNGISVSENCIGTESLLKIDTLYNSTVEWYFKKNRSDNDSVYLGGGFQFDISPLTFADTGYYYCKIEINNGCINRNYGFNLTGDCYPVLPVLQVELTGRYNDAKSYLHWSIRNDFALKNIYVERKNGENFETIGSVDPAKYSSPGMYDFTDENPLDENFYRLRLEFNNGKSVYSKVIRLNGKSPALIQVYPNPAIQVLNIDFAGSPNGSYQIELMNVASQKSILKDQVSGRQYTIHRTPSMAAGVYILKVTELKTGIVTNFKVIFNNQ